MNQTKFNVTIAQKQCQTYCLNFHSHSVHILILHIYYTSTALAVITLNSVLLNKILKRRQKTRADKIFIILSCSDIGVGLFSIPIISLELFKCDFGVAGSVFSLVWYFSVFFPYSFSWTLIIIIALVRVIIIIKAQVYKKYVTMKILYRMIILCLLSTFVVITLCIMERKSKPKSRVMFYIVLSGELCFIFTTIIACVYLFHFVQSKSGVIENKKHGGINFNKKLMITITYTYMCVLLFTLPHFVGLVIHFFIRTRDQKMLKYLQYWITILPYSNSYANAIIILYRSRGNQTTMRENEKEQREY